MARARFRGRPRTLMLVVVLVVVLAAPPPAHADALTALAITSLAVAGVILIGYLVVANVEGARRADAGRPLRLACVGGDCRVGALMTVADAATPVQAP